MKKVIVPVDFSAASERAARYAENVFKGQPVEIELIYVAPKAPNEDDQEILGKFSAFEKAVMTNAAINYEFHIRRGVLLDEIQKAINELQPCYVIMGTSGASLAKALVKLTDCPVIVIPDIGKKSKIKTIAFANDFNDIKVTRALEPLLDISRSFGAKVHILHVSKERNVPSDKAEAAIEYYLDGVAHEYVSITGEDIVAAIHDYVAKNNIDLLAVLIRDHGGNVIDSRGALVEKLVSDTEVPLLSLI